MARRGKCHSAFKFVLLALVLRLYFHCTQPERPICRPSPAPPSHCTSFVLTAAFDICNVDSAQIRMGIGKFIAQQSFCYSQHVAQEGARGDGQADAYCHCQR